MSLTFDATVGGASANSYITVAVADAYHAGRLHNATWTAASDATKKAALVWATRILDALEWAGTKPSTTQRLRWPRAWVERSDTYSTMSGTLTIATTDIYYDDTAIPGWLQDATAELAWRLIDEDRSEDSGMAGYKEIEVGSIRLVADIATGKRQVPDAVQNMIRPYLMHGSGASLRLMRA